MKQEKELTPKHGKERVVFSPSKLILYLSEVSNAVNEPKLKKNPEHKAPKNLKRRTQNSKRIIKCFVLKSVGLRLGLRLF